MYASLKCIEQKCFARRLRRNVNAAYSPFKLSNQL